MLNEEYFYVYKNIVPDIDTLKGRIFMKKIIFLSIMVGFFASDSQTAFCHVNNSFYTEGDKTTIGSSQISLNNAINYAIKNNPYVAAKTYEAEAASQRVSQFKGAILPKSQIIGSMTHYTADQRLYPATFNGETGIFSPNIATGEVIVSIPLYNGGRLMKQVAASELLYMASQKQLSRTIDEIIYNVTSIYYSILAQKKVIGSLEFSLKALVSHLGKINQMLSVGKAANVDMLRTEVRIADIKQQILKEKNLLAVQHRILGNILGISDDVISISDDENLGIHYDFAIPNLSDSLEKALTSRGDYLSALNAIMAQEKNIQTIKTFKLPTLSIQGSYAGRFGFSPTTGSGEKDVYYGKVGVMADFSLFDGFQTDSKIREQMAIYNSLKMKFISLRMQIKLEIETAILNINSLMERSKAVLKTIDQAKESLRIEEEKYTFGKGSVIDILDAQSALLESEKNFYKIQADFHIALAQLKFSMGEK